MNIVYRFRIYPNKDQQELFAKTFGCVRFVYNRMLAEKKEHYEKNGSCCGRVKEHLGLEERIYRCECGNRMDRDENAAVNIRREGLRMLGISLDMEKIASWQMRRTKTVGHTGITRLCFAR